MTKCLIAFLVALMMAVFLAMGCGSETVAPTTTAEEEVSSEEWEVNQTEKLGDLNVTLYKVIWKDGVLSYDIEFRNPNTTAVDLNSTSTFLKFITYTDKGQQFERAMMNSLNDPLPEVLQPGVAVRKQLRITSNETVFEANSKKENIILETKVVHLIVQIGHDTTYEKAKKIEFICNVDI